MHLLPSRPAHVNGCDFTNLTDLKATRPSQGVSGIRTSCSCHRQRAPRAAQPQRTRAVDNSSPSTPTGNTISMSTDRGKQVVAFCWSRCHEPAGGMDR